MRFALIFGVVAACGPKVDPSGGGDAPGGDDGAGGDGANGDAGQCGTLTAVFRDFQAAHPDFEDALGG